MESVDVRLVDRVLLTGPRSLKKVYHLCFEDLAPPAQLGYQHGDSLAIYPENSSTEISKILQRLNISDAKSEMVHGTLQKQYCITHLSEAFLNAVHAQLNRDDVEKFEEYRAQNVFQNVSLWDMLSLFPSIQFSAGDLLPLLKKIRPRLYSVASSPMKFPSQIQLIVAEVFYENFFKNTRYGVTSHYLCEKLPLGQEISAMIVRSKFKLPQDSSKDVIMVGAGTGIAPFRSFLQEREILRKTHHRVGNNWLFFGEQHRESNFYYENELIDWQKNGNLTRLDLAFSRDQDYKIYVQDRMKEQGEAIWDWLRGGAYFYVCGDASRMAVDVENALKDIIFRHGKIDDPENFVSQLKREGRYQRDVY